MRLAFELAPARARLLCPPPTHSALATCTHDHTTHCTLQTTALLVKRAATTKRKLAALQESLGERTAEAEGRLKKLTSSAAKQRNISDVLKCLMPAADAE